uniref:Uncharacterized protein n=1 Tax=Anguilla anguilla TaxID=7936 RepID=A0A0E9WPB5_ANGAN
MCLAQTEPCQTPPKLARQKIIPLSPVHSGGLCVTASNFISVSQYCTRFLSSMSQMMQFTKEK